MLFNYSFCHTKGIACVFYCSYVWPSDGFYTKLKPCTYVRTYMHQGTQRGFSAPGANIHNS